MDFVEDLPISGSANAILVVIDKFTKFGHLLPLHHPFTAQTVARLFIDQVYRLHGLPSAIILTGIRYSLVHYGNNCFSWLGLNCASVLLITHRLTPKQSDLISVLKHICAILFMPAQPNGSSGYL
jgi:hypothetical protein